MKHRVSSKANRSAVSLDQAVLHFARAFQLGQAKASAELKKQGHAVSASGVRYIWKKHNLETAYKRLKTVLRAPDGATAKLSLQQRNSETRGRQPQDRAQGATRTG